MRYSGGLGYFIRVALADAERNGLPCRDNNEKP